MLIPQNLILTIICIQFMIMIDYTDCKKKESKFDTHMKQQRLLCQNKLWCNHQPREFNDNCIHQCISPQCYQNIYAKNPLEDGEYDYNR